jgi:hypothetical protein
MADLQVTNSYSKKASNFEGWKRVGDKEGGANSAGDLGGVYEKINTPNAQKALIKQDPNPAKVIAEFLGAKVHRAIEEYKDYHADIEFMAVGEKGRDNPYIASLYIPNYQGDLFKYAYISENGQNSNSAPQLKVPESRPRWFGTRGKIAKSFGFETVATRVNKVLDRTEGFAEAIAPRLLTNDMDMHIGNLGVVNRDGKEVLVSIDYGAANSKLEYSINPHSHSKHLPGFGPTNHFREFQRKYKITPEFAKACTTISKHDYNKAIDQAFSEIAEFNNIKAIRDFGKLIGMSNKELAAVGLANKQALVEQIKDHYKTVLKERQKDMGRLAAQIKFDLFFKEVDQNKKYEILSDIIKEHSSYLQEILNGTKELKFRGEYKGKNYKKHFAEALEIIKNNKEVIKNNLEVLQVEHPKAANPERIAKEQEKSVWRSGKPSNPDINKANFNNSTVIGKDKAKPQTAKHNFNVTLNKSERNVKEALSVTDLDYRKNLKPASPATREVKQVASSINSSLKPNVSKLIEKFEAIAAENKVDKVPVKSGITKDASIKTPTQDSTYASKFSSKNTAKSIVEKGKNPPSRNNDGQRSR